MSERMFKVREAAGELYCSSSGVYDLCTKRLLRHVRIGAGRRGIRIPASAIREYLDLRMVSVIQTERIPSKKFRFVKLPLESV